MHIGPTKNNENTLDSQRRDNYAFVGFNVEDCDGLDRQQREEVEKLNQYLHFILIEKTTGEAAAKIKSVEEGEGLHAYFKVYWWFVKTAGIAIQERSRKVMQPEPITKEEKMTMSLMNYLPPKKKTDGSTESPWPPDKTKP